MSILIIEDDPNKLKEVSKFLKDTFPVHTISKAKSYQTGLKSIIRDAPSFIVLDMTMTTFDATEKDKGGRTRPFAGRDILREISRKGIMTPTVIVTQFEAFGEGDEKMTFAELDNQLNTEFNDIYQGMVYYHPAQSDWKEKLASITYKCVRNSG